MQYSLIALLVLFVLAFLSGPLKKLESKIASSHEDESLTAYDIPADEVVDLETPTYLRKGIQLTSGKSGIPSPVRF
ncbi:hypothetical protein [Maridesulfovibrio hydrothermalis]|uniref:Uncharacterized protein n=1 Tax=Maridesulfovibrio hydrothermalis AM13 = DSM 14728 TaxID=1121451 RepID=L0R7U1_9BACT|nr:hypothetical protein [Maridesulfovibrio hydrothermalis]CCO22265.1 exported protein of unknown function [Maridesulfovibrio hydrothermalis AM13 = DSM 14728]